MAEASQIRIWVEAEDGGYLLPIGATLDSVDHQELRQRGDIVYTLNPAVRLFIGGAGVNHGPSQTAQSVFDAIGSFVEFFGGNKRIKRVCVCQAGGDSPLGGESPTQPGIILREFVAAYDPDVVPESWTVMDYGIEEVILPFSFGFKLTIQNFPQNDAEPYDIGDIRSVEFLAEREVSNGLATYTVSLDIKLMPYEDATRPLAIVAALAAGGSASLPDTFGPLDRPVSTSMAAAVISGIARDSKIQSVFIRFRKLTGDFSARIVAAKPTRRGSGYDRVLTMKIEASATAENGLRFFDPKIVGSPKLIQRVANESGTVTVKIDVQDFENLIGPDGFARIMGDVRQRIGIENIGIETGYDMGRFTGEVTGDNTETRNTLSATFRIEVIDPSKLKMIQERRGRTFVRGQGSLTSLPEAVEFAFRGATLDAMLGGADTSFITEDVA